MEASAGMPGALERDDDAIEYIDLRHIGQERLESMISPLQFQQKLFFREMKGALFPAKIALNGNEVILDFLCGPGNWCMDVRNKYPEIQLWGVDVSQTFIDLARANATYVNADHLHFQVIDRTRSLPFPDAMFDVIHLQNGTSFFSLHQWAPIMAEITRVLKPGGWLNLVDFEMGPASQPAVDRVLTLFGQMLVQLGRSTAPNGKWPLTGSTLGPRRMTEHSFTEIGYHLYPVDLGGWNNPSGRAYLAWNLVRPEMIMSLAERTGISTTEELRPLLREVQRELHQFGFCGVGAIISSFGCKPL